MDCFANEYGWKEDYILCGPPWKRLIEYMRKIATRHGKPMPRGGQLLDSELTMQSLIMQYNQLRKEM